MHTPRIPQAHPLRFPPHQGLELDPRNESMKQGLQESMTRSRELRGPTPTAPQHPPVAPTPHAVLSNATSWERGGAEGQHAPRDYEHPEYAQPWNDGSEVCGVCVKTLLGLHTPIHYIHTHPLLLYLFTTNTQAPQAAALPGSTACFASQPLCDWSADQVAAFLQQLELPTLIIPFR